MSETVDIQVELPDDLARLRLPKAVDQRLHELLAAEPAHVRHLRELLDKQDHGDPLSESERKEAEGLVDLAEMLSLLRLRVSRAQEPAA